MYFERFDKLTGSEYPAGITVLTAGYAICDSGWNGEVINPPYSRLYFVMRGDLSMIGQSGKESTEKEIRLKAGCCCIVPSGYSFTYSATDEVEHLYFHLQIRRSDGIDALGKIGSPMLTYSGDKDMTELLSACRGKDKLSDIKAHLEILGAIGHFIKTSGVDLGERRRDAEVEAAIGIILAEPRLGIRLSNLAGRLHISKRTLTRKFKAVLGMTVGEYIEKTVLGLCEGDLLYSDLSLSEISEKYGFSDRFYFSRKFKEHYGTSPKKYRDRGVL